MSGSPSPPPPRSAASSEEMQTTLMTPAGHRTELGMKTTYEELTDLTDTDSSSMGAAVRGCCRLVAAVRSPRSSSVARQHGRHWCTVLCVDSVLVHVSVWVCGRSICFASVHFAFLCGCADCSMCFASVRLFHVFLRSVRFVDF